jgi:CHAT domain-containing protein
MKSGFECNSKFSLTAAVLIWTFESCFGSQSGENSRKRLEGHLHAVETAQSYDYDSARVDLLHIIHDSEAAGYWDICLKALSELANSADKNYRYQEQQLAVEKGQLLLQSKHAYLDSIDQSFSVRGNMYLMISSYYRNNGEFDKAIDMTRSLVQRLKSYRNVKKEDVFNAYAYLADLYMKTGLYEKVYEYYILAGKTIPDGKDEHVYFSYIHDLYLGSYFYRIKNYALAKTYYIQALKKIRHEKNSLKYKSYLITNYDILGLIYQSLNQRDSALICLKKSLSLQSANDPDILDTYEYYGDCLLNFNDFQGALEYYRKIFKNLSRGNNYNAYKKAGILSKIAISYQKTGHDPEAIRNCQMAFAIIFHDSSYVKNATKNPEYKSVLADKTLIRLLILKSNAQYELALQTGDKLKGLLQSLTTYRLSSQVIDQFRHKISTDDFKEFFVTDIRKMYQNAIHASYSAYQITHEDSIIELAFYFMEKSKNQVLLDAIKANSAMKYSNIPDSLVASENQYKNKMVTLQNMLYRLKFNDADSQLINNCQYMYAKTQASYDEFLNHLENSYPGYYTLKYGMKVPTILETKRIIGKNLLIEYMVGDDFISMIAFNYGKSIFRLLPYDSTFSNQLTALLRDLGNTGVDENKFNAEIFRSFVRRASALYTILLKPALDEFAGTDRLIIIPDERLCFLPFDILIDKLPDNLNVVNYRNLHYLLKNYITCYEFSTELYSEHHHMKRQYQDENAYIGFAPAYTQKEGLKRVNVLGRESAAFLTPLTYNRREIEEAAAIFDGKAFLGERANAKNFRENCATSTIIHIAAHTVINDSIPELSGIFFSDDQEGGLKGTDFYHDVVYVNELYNLRINARLAILSACATGKGKLLKGEGLISIGRAFQYAGCPSMIMSLWKISDRSASEIMKLFCRHLKKGESVDVALRHAKIDYLNQAESAGRTHPFYWSAFVLIGNNEPLFHRNIMWPALCALVLPVILIFLILRRKVRRTR